MTGQYKKKVRNQRINLRVTSDEHRYFWELCDKKGIDISELIINSIMNSNYNVQFPKGSIEDKYQKAIKTEYDSSMYDVVIKSEVSRATWEYHAIRLIKKCITKQAEPKNLKSLLKVLKQKAREVYKSRKLTSTFTRLDEYLTKKNVYVTLRARVMQTSEDRMLDLLNRIIDEVNHRKQK